MKCRRCRGAQAVIELPSHHAAFCTGCFFLFFRRQVVSGIKAYSLLSADDRVLVCVSGGKDSLVLWDILMELGYRTEGLHIDLGIEGYSDRSKDKALAFAAARGREPIVVDLRAEGIPIPEAARRIRRPECSICGTVKRYFFNRVAAERGFTAVATGHNLDDEAARLAGNLLHWDGDRLARQHPLLPGTGTGLVRKVKPLWRVGELETAAYGVLKGIDYVTEECPMSVDATSLVYKEALDLIEEKMPGTRLRFYQEFLRNRAKWGDAGPEEDGEAGAPGGPTACAACGAPSYTETCAVCRLRERIRKP